MGPIPRGKNWDLDRFSPEYSGVQEPDCPIVHESNHDSIRLNCSRKIRLTRLAIRARLPMQAVSGCVVAPESRRAVLLQSVPAGIWIAGF